MTTYYAVRHPIYGNSLGFLSMTAATLYALEEYSDLSWEVVPYVV